ncbi:ABC transporter permease [Pedobacter sp. BAL39]|uniref:ABC transporter permease n=1 Tax=Pedobacter sp. BAL39 TaxID=391596 RepID=UPI00015599A5|nr:FtsX-like permease family protein [Pedobacter sp. BAL39]EDM38311.1 ABC transporter permease [Pedobacter sp. BAL39]
MYKHLFRLIWNKRKQNFLFLSEILVSFLVIFALSSFLVFYFMNFRKPLGFKYQHVWAVSYSEPLKTKNLDSIRTFYDLLNATLMSMPEIEAHSLSSGNFPYANSVSTSGFTVKGKNYSYIHNYTVEDSYLQTLDLKLLEGRWYRPEDAISKNRNVVINESLRKQIFGSAPALNQVMGDSKKENEKMKIIGVVKDVKANGDYWPSGSAIYYRMDSSSYTWVGTMLIKIRPGTGAAFENKLHKVLAQHMKNSNIEIKHMDEMRSSKNADTIVPMTIFVIIAAFLIINVALGLFGVLWYNINRRKGEIGLRRAMGATANSITRQLVAESSIMATISVLTGTFFAIQFPLLHVFDINPMVYVFALLITIAFIYLLVVLCSIYPGRQAASIHPAVALHED